MDANKEKLSTILKVKEKKKSTDKDNTISYKEMTRFKVRVRCCKKMFLMIEKEII